MILIPSTQRHRQADLCKASLVYIVSARTASTTHSTTHIDKEDLSTNKETKKYVLNNNIIYKCSYNFYILIFDS